MSRTISPSWLSSHSAHIWSSERGSRAHCGPLVARRDSDGLRPSLHVGGARPGREGVAPSHARDASIYRCDAGRGASRRGAGRLTTRCGALHDARRGFSRHGAWHHGKLRNAGRALESTGAAQDGDCAATPSIAVRSASTHGDGHLLLLVLDLMLLGRCSVDDLSLALGSHARLS